MLSIGSSTHVDHEKTVEGICLLAGSFGCDPIVLCDRIRDEPGVASLFPGLDAHGLQSVKQLIAGEPLTEVFDPRVTRELLFLSSSIRAYPPLMDAGRMEQTITMHPKGRAVYYMEPVVRSSSCLVRLYCLLHMNDRMQGCHILSVNKKTQLSCFLLV
jgi:hypothetical protein